MYKSFKKTLFFLLIILLNTGCISSWLSVGEEKAMCDKETKRLGQCAGISDIMNNKYKYMNEYMKGVTDDK